MYTKDDLRIIARALKHLLASVDLTAEQNRHAEAAAGHTEALINGNKPEHEEHPVPTTRINQRRDMKPTKDSAELRELFDRLRIDMYSELMTDKFYAEKAARLLDEYEPDFDALTTAQVAAAELDILDRLIPDFDGVGGIGYQYDDESRVSVDVRMEQVAAHLTTDKEKTK